MPSLELLIRIAAIIQWADAVANVVVPRKINLREHLRRMPPLIRQIYISHWSYIIYILAAFGCLCWLFAPELAGASSLGRFLSGMLAIFWLPRGFIQIFYFDREFRRQNRAADVAFALSSLFLGAIFTAGALGVGR
jgi:hypothetical protein